MTTNIQGANFGVARGTQSTLKIPGTIAIIILATWATAAPALANNLDSTPKANRTASMTHRIHVADPESESCSHVMPLILGIGF